MTDLCAEVEALLEELALGVLPRDQERRLRAHLEGCPRHPTAQELLLAGAAIAFEPEPVAPPAALRERVLAVAERRRTSGVTRQRGRVVVGAAALLVAAAAAGAWYVARDGTPEAAIVARGGGDQGGASLELRERDAQAFVTVAGLPLPPAGMAYQLWLVQGEAWHPLTTFVPDREGRWSGAVLRPFAPGDWLCVTLEQAGGASWPTSAPVVAATIER